MAKDTVKRQWILNAKNEKVAPYTLMSQVIHDASGDTLDIYLDKINNPEENIYILSQSMMAGEDEEKTLKRLLNISSFKIIVLDKDISISSPLSIFSDTHIIGKSKDITLSFNDIHSVNTLQITDDISNIYLSNFSIKATRGNYAISIGGSRTTINCENCILDNIKCINGIGCKFYANNLILNNLTITGGEQTISTKYGLECKGTNFNIKNCTVDKHNQVKMEINNSEVSNLTISNYCNDILFSGNNNTYNNIVSINNNHYVKIIGNNIFYQGKNLNNVFNNFSATSEEIYNVGDFVLDVQNSTMMLTVIRDINKQNSFIYGVKLLSNNTSNILIINGNYNDDDNKDNILADYVASSDKDNGLPIQLEIEDARITYLGNGRYIIDGTFENETFPLTADSSIFVPNMGRYFVYPIYLSIVSQEESDKDNSNIYIGYHGNGAYHLTIRPEQKYTDYIDLRNYNGEKYIYLSGSFNHTIISLQSFISFGKSKIDIGK